VHVGGIFASRWSGGGWPRRTMVQITPRYEKSSGKRTRGWKRCYGIITFSFNRWRVFLKFYLFFSAHWWMLVLKPFPQTVFNPHCCNLGIFILLCFLPLACSRLAAVSHCRTGAGGRNSCQEPWVNLCCFVMCRGSSCSTPSKKGSMWEIWVPREADEAGKEVVAHRVQ